ncbi:UvrABC system protein A [Oligella ureolytica]
MSLLRHICHGKRYNRETLEIRYRGLNIYEVLELTVEQALDYFSNGTCHSTAPANSP